MLYYAGFIVVADFSTLRCASRLSHTHLPTFHNILDISYHNNKIYDELYVFFLNWCCMNQYTKL